ncbi:protein translocase subunit SecD [bacterium]|nr:protein translocase subunit SecD [bacterium]
MSNKPFFWRFLVFAVVLVLSLVFVAQTVSWYKISDEERKLRYPPEEYAKKYKKVIKLGLDLQGGIHLVLGADISKVKPEERQDVVDRIITVIRSRIDEFGVNEPVIKKEGFNKIVVELPGMKDPDRAVNLVTQTAFLEFKLVDENNQPKVNLFVNEDMTGPSEIPLPPNNQLLFEEHTDPATGLVRKIPYLIKKPSLLNGNELKSARVDFNEFQSPVVKIDFKPKGGRVFARITEENVGKRLAIILNGKVVSAPVINERIPDGSAVISGQASLQESRDLALVLRAGALPAPVQILENQTVGPTLGKDSIMRGKNALLLGLLLVFAFIIVVYRWGGVIVDLALVVDFVVILGIMSLFNFSLTFPGIAGLVLTVGMAVDANILIFERIKEEMRTGNSIISSVRRGFGKAFLTILDANVTTLIAAAVLFQFGTGPLKGFAVTLSIGILAGMFGALVFTRMCFEYLLGTVKIKKLSI